MDIQSLVDAQIFSERLLNSRRLFIATYCVNACEIPKSQRIYESTTQSVSEKDIKCMGGCLRKVSTAFKELIWLDSMNSMNFERKHSISEIQERLDKPNLDYGNYSFN